jgi:hypothetical protein
VKKKELTREREEREKISKEFLIQLKFARKLSDKK